MTTEQADTLLLLVNSIREYLAFGIAMTGLWLGAWAWRTMSRQGYTLPSIRRGGAGD